MLARVHGNDVVRDAAQAPEVAPALRRRCLPALLVREAHRAPQLQDRSLDRRLGHVLHHRFAAAWRWDEGGERAEAALALDKLVPR